MLPTIVTVNPFMAKRKHKARHHRRARRAHYRTQNPMRHHRRHHARRRRKHHSVLNPFKLGGTLTKDLTGALIGAGGAIATDVAMAYAAPYLPASLTSGWLNVLTRAAAAVGVGYVAGKVAGRDTGKAVTAGGLIVVAYSGLKQALAPTLGQSIKGLSGLADFGDYRPALPAYSTEGMAMSGAGMGAYMTPRMGAYMAPRLGAYMNPAAFISGGSSPLVAKQRAMSGFGAYGGYDSDSM